MAMHQPAFDDPGIDWGGRPLADTTFCVVDLETTGGSPKKGSKITEVGAVKVRGGEILGEFQTLVNPDQLIPAFITVLTGITDQMVVEAPRIAEVLPSFLEFARGTVLVAHNAPFDVGFLKHAAGELGIDWPGFDVVDTAVLARRTLLRDEVPNVKLATLAARFSPVQPDHRALTDARATVDVLHALFERLGTWGVSTVEDVASFTSKVTPAQRRKKHLADGLPDAPGVYLFRDARGDVLYVGTSRSLRTRVRSYFTKAETRTRMGEMIALAEKVDTVVCATDTEARVRELRLIDRHRPPYNRRSKFPERAMWLRLTDEPWPRISLVRGVVEGAATHIGPFGSRKQAEAAMATLHDAFRIRQCTGRLPLSPSRAACVLAELGQCLSPCDGTVTVEDYTHEVGRVRRAMSADPVEVVAHLEQRMAHLATSQRFEDAAVMRDRAASLIRAVRRTQRLDSLAREPELIAAAPHDEGWQIHVVRHGRLAAAAILPRDIARTPGATAGWVDTLLTTAESVEPAPRPMPAALIEETESLLRWLESPGVRMVRGSWTSAWPAAARHLERFDVERQFAMPAEAPGLG
ncbi:DEDD exonuclease domain-containing protein [Aeromicrobium sp. 179-A 4D2 NHS]|uniref:DEDD exonuclease domain-containing protein n=1 Tax=Aeromicrobium sp. 179-A 4D2 NHS TaxID=3142375 RepID=UPI0039A0A077